jgi:hypothetical protein
MVFAAPPYAADGDEAVSVNVGVSIPTAPEV